MKTKLFMLAAASIVALSAAVGRSAVELPPDSVGPDTIFVIHADSAHLTPALLRKSAEVVLGDNIDSASSFLAKFQDRFDKATAAGLDSVTIMGTTGQRIEDAGAEVGVNPDGTPRRRTRPNPPVVYYHMRAGGDANAIEQVVTQDIPEKQKQDLRFEPMDNWIVMHEKHQTPPEKVDADRAAAFTAAFGTIPDAAVGIVVIPDARMKAEMQKAAQRKGTPELARSALPVMAGSKWMILSITVGNDPAAMATVNTTDAISAGTLRQTASAALDDLKEQMNEASEGPMVLIGPLVSPLLDGFKPSANGNSVTVSVKGDTLNSLANLFMTIRSFSPPPPAAADQKPPAVPPAPARITTPGNHHQPSEAGKAALGSAFFQTAARGINKLGWRRCPIPFHLAGGSPTIRSAMLIKLLRAKIHHATVTQTDVNYHGSITIDADLMKACGLLPNEAVIVADCENGNRFETYTIIGEPGSGVIGINGAAGAAFPRSATA